MPSKQESERPSETIPADGRSAFAERPASQAWERLFLPESPQNYVWAWFKPVTAPQGLILRIPDETYRERPEFAAQWTMRKLLLAAAIEPVAVSAWLFQGISYPGMNGASPYLDAPLPMPVAGASPDIAVYIQSAPVFNGPLLAGGPIGGLPHYAMPPMVPMMPVPQLPGGALPMAINVSHAVNGAPLFQATSPNGLMPGQNVPSTGAGQPAQPLDATTADIYERIEADWNSSNEMEKDLTRLRKQLVDVLGRLKTLNRDLNGPERVHSNNQDKKDWQDARRGLRDATNRVWKYLKAHDIGDTSNAGKRVWFEEIYRKQIAPRKPFKELMATARAFESHRKTITTLHGDMSNAYSYASIDCERKALQVLNRIQTKVREASNKKNFLGVILDS